MGILYADSLFRADNIFIHDVTLEPEDFMKHTQIDQSSLASAELTFETTIESEKLNSIFGIDSSKKPSFSATFKGMYPVQRRIHKKKRINKKWAKRYGYIYKPKDLKIDNVTFETMDEPDPLGRCLCE